MLPLIKLRRPTGPWLYNTTLYPPDLLRTKIPTIVKQLHKCLRRCPKPTPSCRTQRKEQTTTLPSRPSLAALLNHNNRIISTNTVSSHKEPHSFLARPSSSSSSNPINRSSPISSSPKTDSNNHQWTFQYTSRISELEWVSLHSQKHILEASHSRWPMKSSARPFKSHACTFDAICRIEQQVHNSPEMQQQLAVYNPAKKYVPPNSTIVGEKTIERYCNGVIQQWQTYTRYEVQHS